MMTADSNMPAISIRQRYHDMVAERWSVTVTSQPEELLSSWLHRLAYASGVPPKAFARVLGLTARMWSASLDLRMPADIADLLYAKTGVTSEQLASKSLSQDLPERLLLPLRHNVQRHGSAWLQFCCRCLAEDERPYFRRRWRLATRVSCTQHGCRLRDRCPSCHGCIAAFDQSELVPQHYCTGCGYDLRHARGPYLSPAAKILDRCLDNICSAETIAHAPSGPVFLRRLLRLPCAVNRHYSTMFTSLSTAARSYCAERLSHPSGGPIIHARDEDRERKARHLRRMIPPTSDHTAWTALLANALGSRNRRQVTLPGSEPVIKLADLLVAYARMNPSSRPGA